MPDHHILHSDAITSDASCWPTSSIDDLDVLGPGGFLRINLTTGGNTNTADDPIAGLAGYPSARNLRFTNLRLDHVNALVEARQIAPEKPVEGLELRSVTGTCAAGMTLAHMTGVELSDIRVTGFTGPRLRTDQVSGRGLADAVALLPAAVQFAWQVSTLDPDDGSSALVRFRSNRWLGLLVAAACYVVGNA